MNWAQFLNYDQTTGVLSWRITRIGRGCEAGREVGTVKSDGRYRSFVLHGKRYYTHRVAWEIVNGPIPEGMCIDHIDGNGLNNSLTNLRLTTLSGNQRNRCVCKNSRTGVPGVVHHGNRKGFNVTCAGKYIGYTTDFSKAVAMRRDAEAANDYHQNNGRIRNGSA